MVICWMLFGIALLKLAKHYLKCGNFVLSYSHDVR